MVVLLIVSDSSLPLRQWLPRRAAATEPAGTPAQQAFRQAIYTVEELREQLAALRAAQATARQTYWRAVAWAARSAASCSRNSSTV
ncbi:MAG: hypothetical protein EOO61_22985 [Hymenobacter sp.]|nr:MAG: hypothetical protein EOO61_22985 [Hymenobacter sp.]